MILTARVAQQLIAQARCGALHVGQLLGGEDDAQPGFAAARNQLQDVIGP